MTYWYVHGQTLDNIEENVLDPSALARQTWEHVYISVTIAVLVVAIAVPLGVLVTRPLTRASAPFVLAVVNVGQAAPSLGLIALVGTVTVGFWPVVLVLTAYAILSVLRNTSPASRPSTGACSTPRRGWACRRWRCCCASSARSRCR